MKRREFIKTSSFATVAVLSIPTMLQAGKSKKAIGLQLYTLKDVINKDPKGVLKQVASFGYKQLETYGYKEGQLFGLSNAEFAKYVGGLGMEVISGHYGIDIVRNDWERAVSDAKAIGQKYMVVPWLDQKYRTSDGIKEACEIMNKGGEMCNQYGIRMGYHNHDFEFKEVDGKIMYDVMLAELDNKLVGQELDIYWIVFAGFDPVQYFEKYPGRFEQWHVKDMDKAVRANNTEIGKGTIDYKKIFAKAQLSGMKHFYVEQEYFTGSPLDSVKESAEYLKKIL